MRKRKLSKLTIGIMMTLCLGVAPLTGCSTIFGEDGFVITDINWSINQTTGNVDLTIVTTNEENPILTFTIPQGIAGVDGVGIKDITSTSETIDGITTINIVIKYTDSSLTPTTLSFPIKNGEDGKGIKTINVDNDESGNIIVQFIYTDDSKSQDIVIPRGIDGKDGTGIKNVTIDDSDSENVKITIYFTDSSIEPQIIELPKGVGIAGVAYDESRSSDEEYALAVTYTNGYIEIIKLPRPQSVEWHTGLSTPSNKIGKNGDFYLNTASGFVFKKVGGEWIYLFSMKGSGSAVEFVVTFYPNGGIWTNPQLKDNAVYNVPVKYGEYIDLEKFPTIEKDGFIFNGWWTSIDDNPNAGHLTDLTPILKDINVYANWIKM